MPISAEPAGVPEARATHSWSKLKLWPAALAAAVMVLLGGVAFQSLHGASHTTPRASHDAAPAAFVGSEACADCHHTEAELWRGSQHKLAMQHATEQTVLGDFNDARFDYYGVPAPLLFQGGRVFVGTRRPT